MSNGTQNETDDPCSGSLGYLDEKMWIIIGLGAPLATISFLQNSFLVYLFWFRKSLRESYHFYFGILAVVDISLATSYILLFPVQILMEHYRSLWLSRLWHGYMKLLLTFVHVATTTSVYIILVASIERLRGLRQTTIPMKETSLQNRLRLTLCAFGMACLFKVSIFFEMDVSYNPSCSNNNRYQVYLRKFASAGTNYGFYWAFCARNIFTIFLPFFYLAWLNVAIIKELRIRKKTATRAVLRRSSIHSVVIKILTKDSTIRTATQALSTVIILYLIGNLLNIFITSWEHIDKDSLRYYGKFYILGSDLVSILTIFGGAVRLEVYYGVNSLFQNELGDVLTSLRRRSTKTDVEQKISVAEESGDKKIAKRFSDV